MNAEQLEEITRHFSVVSEALRSDIRLIAESHATLCHELRESGGENQDEFKEMQALLQLSFPQLDQHIHTLETNLADLKNRIDRLETSHS
jgi:uncharacterized protein YceH (UPF0502 family)